jgi:hypothetical protein
VTAGSWATIATQYITTGQREASRDGLPGNFLGYALTSNITSPYVYLGALAYGSAMNTNSDNFYAGDLSMTMMLASHTTTLFDAFVANWRDAANQLTYWGSWSYTVTTVTGL